MPTRSSKIASPYGRSSRVRSAKCSPSTVDVWQLGGPIDDVGPDESAFAGRGTPDLLGVEANWEDAAADEATVARVRDCLDDTRAWSGGSVYLNFPGFGEGGGRRCGPRSARPTSGWWR